MRRRGEATNNRTPLQLRKETNVLEYGAEYFGLRKRQTGAKERPIPEKYCEEANLHWTFSGKKRRSPRKIRRKAAPPVRTHLEKRKERGGRVNPRGRLDHAGALFEGGGCPRRRGGSEVDGTVRKARKKSELGLLRRRPAGRIRDRCRLQKHNPRGRSRQGKAYIVEQKVPFLLGRKRSEKS